MFTLEQITFLEELIDQRIARSKRSFCNTDKPYHTVPEIRQLILDNLPQLLQRFPFDDFELGAFRLILSEYTTLRSGDKELNGTSRDAKRRWDSQVGIALTQDWPGEQSPIRKIEGRNGRFRFICSLKTTLTENASQQ